MLLLGQNYFLTSKLGLMFWVFNLTFNNIERLIRNKDEEVEVI